LSDEILSKSRTELDRQSFTRDVNDKIARRVIDSETHDKLDNIIANLGGTTSVELVYNEVTSVAAAALTTIVTYTATGSKTVKGASASGTNIAVYELVLNGSVIDKKWTNFGGDLSVDFNTISGLDLTIGDILLIRVTHSRGSFGDFSGNLAISA
jgi:hypothetical protein